jgi:hypothetical protein
MDTTKTTREDRAALRMARAGTVLCWCERGWLWLSPDGRMWHPVEGEDADEGEVSPGLEVVA